MKKRWMLLLMLLMMLLPLGSQAQSSLSQAAVDGKSSNRVHLRQSPSTNAASLGLYYTGTPLEYTGSLQQEWVNVRIGTEWGYMKSTYISQSSSVSLQGPERTVNSSSWVNLRAQPSTNASVLSRCYGGSSVRVLGETASGWSYVDVNGIKGYMMTRYLSDTDGQNSTSSSTTTTRPTQQLTRIVGTTSNGQYIHQYTADNGQSIFFVAVETNPAIEMVDVNFDGRRDLVVTVSEGASNYYVEFFVYQNGQYVMASHDGDGGLANYTLDSTRRMVVSHGNNGFAGSLHEISIYRWQGTNLQLVRRAESRELEVTSLQNNQYTSITYYDQLKITIRDYRSDPYEGSVIWERIVSTQNMDSMYAEEERILWNGL